jgi:hypothetical protein
VRRTIDEPNDESVSLMKQCERFALATRLPAFPNAPHRARAVAVVKCHLANHRELPKLFLRLFRNVIVEIARAQQRSRQSA